MDRQSKNTRTLDMYDRLCEGKIINKSIEAHNFGVDERSIQRDIDDIRAHLENKKSLHTGDGRTVEYSRSKKGFEMTGNEDSLMSNSEILAVSKILLESRAFTKKEMKTLLNKLIQGCVPLENMKLVSDLILNERYHYVELPHKEYIQQYMWKLGVDIQEHNLIQIEYEKRYYGKEVVSRVVEPISIIFSEYYFYLNAFIVERNSSGKYEHTFDYPTIFRLDRIKGYKKLNEKFLVEYANRFEEGEFRKRIQFMCAGRLMKIKLKYIGENPEPILDRLPTAKIIENTIDGYLINAEVYGKGIMMWLLSQGRRVEVLQPESLREEMRNELVEMLSVYQ